VPFPKPNAPQRHPASTESIAERFTTALIEHRRPPGAKSGEVARGENFGIPRTKARQAQKRLSQDKLVTYLEHNLALPDGNATTLDLCTVLVAVKA
jgi:DNA-binding GntR family transcriptional regulator